MSSDQQDTSIDDQQSEIVRFAARLGYRIIRWYRDEGISGDTGNRPGFQSLLKDVQSIRDFDVVLVWNQDRFSRLDILDAAAYWKILRDADVRIVSIKDGELSFSSIQGVLLACINQHGAHDYCKTLSKNVSRGFTSAARAGFWASGRAPDGYRAEAIAVEGKSRKRLAVDENRAPIIRQIFADYASKDLSFREIAARFNRRGILNSRGKAWTGQAVRQVLKNEHYTGSIIRGRSVQGKYTRTISGEQTEVSRRLHYVGKRGKVRAKAVNQERRDWIVAKEAHEPIVDRELFDRVQSKLRGRSEQLRKPRRGASVLAGLCFCGHCGDRLSRTGGDYLRCNSATPGSGGLGPDECRCCYRFDDILEDVLHLLEAERLSDAAIARYRDDILAVMQGNRSMKSETEKELRESGAALVKKIDKLEGRLAEIDDDMVAALSKQIRGLREQLQAVSDRMAALDRIGNVSEQAVAADGVRYSAELKRIRENIRVADADVARAAIAAIISRIEIHSEPATADDDHFNRRRKLSKIFLHCRSATDILSQQNPNYAIDGCTSKTTDSVRQISEGSLMVAAVVTVQAK